MTRTTSNRRRWIPGRQTLTRNGYTDSERQAETLAADGMEWESDATFDPSYGWLDLHLAERAAQAPGEERND